LRHLLCVYLRSLVNDSLHLEQVADTRELATILPDDKLDVRNIRPLPTLQIRDVCALQEQEFEGSHDEREQVRSDDLIRITRLHVASHHQQVTVTGDALEMHHFLRE
jgi:hypothetical protein